MITDNPLIELVTAKAYHADGGTGDVFPTYQAFSYFLRRYAKELCDDNAFIPRQGSAASLVDPSRLPASIRRIMHREGSNLSAILSDSP